MKLDEILHSLAEDIADEFGGDIDEHPQIEYEKIAKSKLTKYIEQEIKKELTKLLSDGTMNTTSYALWVHANIEKRIRELGES